MLSTAFGAVPDTLPGRSTLLWQGCDIPALMTRNSLGILQIDDYHKEFPVGIAASGVGGPYYCFFSAAATIAAATEIGGGLVLTPAGTADLGVSFQRRCTPFRLSSTMGALWYEIAIQTSTIADGQHGIFVGLTDNIANTVTTPLTATSALADRNLIGFHRSEVAGKGDNLDFVFKADGQTAVVALADAVTLVDGTTVKVGFLFDPAAPNDKRITAYKNGEPIPGAYISAATIAGATFPGDINLGTNVAVMNVAGASPGTLTAFWAACAQEYL